MKLCLSSLAYIRCPIETAIERTSKLEFEAIEIMANRPHMLPEDYNDKEVARIASLLKSHNLKVAAITSSNGTPHWHFTHPNKRVRSAAVRHIKNCVDLASHLKAPIVEVVSGSPIIEGISEQDSWEWLLDELADCTDYAKRHKKIIGLEPEPGMVISSSDQADRMMREIGSNSIRLLIDIGHLHVTKEDIPRTVMKMKDKLVHVHIHDNDSTEDQHLVTGEGNINFKPIIEALQKISYSGYLSAEVKQGEGDSAATNTKEYLKNLLN
ncbi:MAG: sugar phosphate isomerase/epimerase family protein [Candidatus Bathyarchaeia archaeon]